jgi:hypothetical protein
MSASVNRSCDDPSKEFLIWAVSAVGVFAWIIPVILLRSWVTTVLWAWYIVPGFNVPPIRMSIAYGATLLIHFVTPHVPDDKKKPWETIGWSIIVPIFSLTVGWIGSFFLGRRMGTGMSLLAEAAD